MIKTKQKKKYKKSKSCINSIIIDIGAIKKLIHTTKKVNLASNIVSAGLVIIGSVAGGITANPIIIGTVTGAGVLLKTFCETKNYKRKIEMSKYASTTYQKILADLKTSLQGGPFNKQDVLKEVNILDDTIIDFCPLVTKFEKQYGEKFLSRPTDQ